MPRRTRPVVVSSTSLATLHPLVHSSVTTNAVRGTLGRALLAPKPAAVLQVLLMV